MRVLLPHQLLEHKVRSDFDKDVRRKFFRGLEFAEPRAIRDGSARTAPPGTCTRTSALIFGLQCAAFMERLDPSIFWMGSDHSRVAERDADGAHRATRSGRCPGAPCALAGVLHRYRLRIDGDCREGGRDGAGDAPHRQGVRPDGLAYDADDPDWLRWNYATVVWESPPPTRCTTRYR